MPLYPEAILFQHQHFPSVKRPSLKLSGLLKASVATDVMVICPLQTEVDRKFTGSNDTGMGPGVA
jgi:hypothetical protein